MLARLFTTTERSTARTSDPHGRGIMARNQGLPLADISRDANLHSFRPPETSADRV